MVEKTNINVYVPKNNTLFIAVIAIFMLFSIVLYTYPSVFVFLFGNILGNVVLAVIVLAVAYVDARWAIGFAALFIILYQAYSLSNKKVKEGFEEWSPQLKSDFMIYEKTNNPNFQFDINVIQKQASPQEVEYLIKNNKWPWSDDIKKMYKEAIMTKSITSIDPGVALDIAQTIYNEAAVKKLLSWNTKEGDFLLTGVTVGHTKGLPDNVNNIVRCGSNGEMEKITNIGYDGINGSMIKNVSPVANSDIPSVVAGFKFLKGDCNPCGALEDPANYSCPFSLNVGDGGNVSSIWANLWGLREKEDEKKEFPILLELKKEINNATELLIPRSNSNNINISESEEGVHLISMDHNDVESPYLNSNF